MFCTFYKEKSRFDGVETAFLLRGYGLKIGA
jgi:hypothetical protein